MSPSMATTTKSFPLSFFSHLIAMSLFSSSKKNTRNNTRLNNFTQLFFVFFFLFTFSLSILIIFLAFTFLILNPVSQYSIQCSDSSTLLSSFISIFHENRASQNEVTLSNSVMVPLPPHGMIRNNFNVPAAEIEFWRQPDGEGYEPCLNFSIDYRKASDKISKQKSKFLVVVVSGGLNQQRNQIVDAVVIARILEAALVVPVLQVNRIWGDESEFSDIFDVEHFKKTLIADVRVVSSLPATHLVSKQTIENQIQSDVSPMWIRAKFLHLINEEGLLILKGIDSRLSKNLSPDLQKLRCKVAFHSLKFIAPIQDLGNQIAKRMWIEGPYIAVHLRLEKDVWVRTGCLTGLGDEFDQIIAKEQQSYPNFLNDKLNMTHSARRFAGLCPLSALEIARLLKALGAPSEARLYIAGGDPFGGRLALQPLSERFPNIVTKKMLARDGELTPYMSRPSVLAAIDYIVSLSSDVFVQSHGGNMGRAMQGHRAYVGHRKHVKPNKRMMTDLFDDSSISEEEFSKSTLMLHKHSIGKPELRNKKVDRDVLAYPVPECMCRH